MELQLDFPHNFEIEPEAKLPGSAGELRVSYFPEASAIKVQDCSLIRFKPRTGGPWLGCFAAGYKSVHALNRITTLPDPNRVCIVASGAGYLIRADSPEEWEKVPVFPVVECVSLVANATVLLGDFTRLCAYGPEGFKWITSRLSSDGLRIKEVLTHSIRVLVWNASRNRDEEVLVDLRTGAVEH